MKTEPAIKHTNHRWVILDDLMISLTTPGLGADSLWAEFADELSTKPVTRYLATAMGSLDVNSIQRKMVSEVCVKRKLPVTVLTDEAIVRGLVTAVSWLGVDIKAYSWLQIKEALQHLKVTQPLLDRAIEATVRLKLTYRPTP